MIKSISMVTVNTPKDSPPSSQFVIADGNNQFNFSVDLILQCLRLAEQQGDIPLLPKEWWCEINRSYHVRIDINEHIQTSSQ